MSTIYLGDCLDLLRSLPEASVDAIVTDPPYGIGFMMRAWDASVPGLEWAQECLRVLRPGGHLVAFGGTRTVHRLAVAIEDAGFEIRDSIGWVYYSGFPKSCDVSKQIDEQARRHWLNVCKAIDSIDQSAMLEGWKIHSGPALSAAQANSRKRRASSALAPVPPPLNADGSPASAPTAESRSSGPHLTIAASSPSVLSPAGVSSTASSDPATTAESRPASLARTLDTAGSSAPCDAWGSPDASTAAKLKGVEALLIWLGSAPSSKPAAFDALIAALTDDWKRITSSPFGLTPISGTSSATGFASATTVTTTGFTAESLISFTVATARSEAERRAAGAEREVVGSRSDGRYATPMKVSGRSAGIMGEVTERMPPALTIPATPAGRQWSGWGTALKPAQEPAILARKPLAGTVAANVLAHGTGALHIDGCRFSPGDAAWVGPDDEVKGYQNGPGGNTFTVASGPDGTRFSPWEASRLGRWPANLYHCPKAPRSERERGCDGLPSRSGAEAVYRKEGSAGAQSPRAGAGGSVESVRNHHCTVKPVRLMRWLCRLVTPPGGLVVDPFLGSGTTGVAAALEGFRFVGAEREPDYHRIAVARIAHAQRYPEAWADTAPGRQDEAVEEVEVLERMGQVRLFGGGE